MLANRQFSERFIHATQRSHVAGLAAEVAIAVAAALRKPAPRSAVAEPEPRDGSTGMSQAAQMIVMADAVRRGEIDLPTQAPEQPEETQASRAESLALLLKAARAAP